MERLLARYVLPRGNPSELAAAIAGRSTPRPSSSDRRELGVPVAGAVESAAHGEASVSYRLPQRLRADDVLTLAAWDIPPGVVLSKLELPAECADRLPRAALGATGIRSRLGIPDGHPLVLMTPTIHQTSSIAHLRDAPNIVRRQYEIPQANTEQIDRSTEIQQRLAAKGRTFLVLGDLARFWDYESPRIDFTNRDAIEAKLVEGAASFREGGADGVVVPLGAAGFDVAPLIADAVGGAVFFEPPADESRPWFVNESRTDRLAGVRRFTREVVYATAARLAGADGVIFRPRPTNTMDARGVHSAADLRDVIDAASAPLAGLPPLLVVLPSMAPDQAAAIRAKRDHVALTSAAGIASPSALRRESGFLE